VAPPPPLRNAGKPIATFRCHTRDVRSRPALGLPLALILASCGGAPSEEARLNQLDAELVDAAPNAAADPAVTAALREQIMVDPALVQSANADAARPPAQPVTAAVPPVDIAPPAKAATGDEAALPPPSATCPACDKARRALTLGALAAGQGGTAGQCAGRVSYSAGWAAKLPASLPLHPDARVLEAAGADGQGCALRVVSFATTVPVERLLGWYWARARAAGFRAEHQASGGEHVVAGTRPGGAFFLSARPRPGGGAEADLMVDGR
jgi:hypothetical protein